MTSSDLCFMILTDIKKRSQYLYNAAKIHALVILFRIWYAKKLSSVHFCFQCFGISDSKLIRCSSCKISTYCSKQCQIGNWKIHKVTCRLLRKNNDPWILNINSPCIKFSPFEIFFQKPSRCGSNTWLCSKPHIKLTDHVHI